MIPEEFETTLNLFERVLRKYLLPRKEINIAIEKIRMDNYGIFRDKVTDTDFSLVKDIPNIDISAISIQGFQLNCKVNFRSELPKSVWSNCGCNKKKQSNN